MSDNIRVDRKIDNAKLILTNGEKEILINALNLFKAIIKECDNENISYASLEENVFNIILEIDDYTNLLVD